MQLLLNPLVCVIAVVMGYLKPRRKWAMLRKLILVQGRLCISCSKSIEGNQSCCRRQSSVNEAEDQVDLQNGLDYAVPQVERSLFTVRTVPGELDGEIQGGDHYSYEKGRPALIQMRISGHCWRQQCCMIVVLSAYYLRTWIRTPLSLESLCASASWSRADLGRHLRSGH